MRATASASALRTRSTFSRVERLVEARPPLRASCSWPAPAAADSRSDSSGEPSSSCAITGVGHPADLVADLDLVQVRRPRVDGLQRERVAHLALLAVVHVDLPAGVRAQAIVGQRVQRRERARVVERRQLLDALLDLLLGGCRRGRAARPRAHRRARRRRRERPRRNATAPSALRLSCDLAPTAITASPRPRLTRRTSAPCSCRTPTGRSSRRPSSRCPG